MMELPKLTLLIGGAASGKSAYAEGLVRDAGGARIYLATAEAWDDEMRAKIDAHKAARRLDGWRTIEAPLDITDALSKAGSDDVILIDCATMWLSNLLHAERDWLVEADKLLSAIATTPARIAIVSNETGQGIVPENALARSFRQAQGELNQRLAAKADLVVAVMAGLPLALKGQLP